MKTTIVFLVLALAPTFAVAAEGSTQTYKGEYQWKQGGNDALDAEFEPAGENSWKIAFRFKWNGGDYNWKGEAEGSLEDGSALTGTVRSDDGRRTWALEASLEDGVLTGKHTETTGGRKYETGTFRLKR